MQLYDRSERFWQKVRFGSEDECWLFTGYCNPDGYGRFDDTLAHRMAYILAKGDIPTNLVVMHKCDNPACCNPKHLHLGTMATNNYDRSIKGRNANQQGERGPRALLKDEQIPQVYALYLQTHSYKKVAQQLGIGLYSVRNIVRGVSWRHLYPLFLKMKEELESEKEPI